MNFNKEHYRASKKWSRKIDNAKALTVFRKTGHKYKVRLTNDSLLYVRGMLLILAADFKRASDGAMAEMERTNGERGQETLKHYASMVRCLTIIESRIRHSFPKDLLVSAVATLTADEATEPLAG